MAKKYSIIMCLLFYGLIVNSQGLFKDSMSLCSFRIKSDSYFWKKDSLADNGFRLYAVQDLVTCKIDDIDSNFLLQQFGIPNKVQKTNHGVEYIYFTYDYRRLPKNMAPVEVIYYLKFKFKNGDKYLDSVYDGHID
jgi:hypothetical protein